MGYPHSIDTDALRGRCIELYSLIKAGCPSDDDEDPLTSTFADFYRFNISRLLLDIAIRARVLDDILRNDESEEAMGKRVFDTHVATFEKGGKGELPLREVTNKIIHAQRIELIGRELEDDWQETTAMCRDHGGELRIVGAKGTAVWVVRLDPIALCREILGWLETADDERLIKLYQ